MVVNEPGSSTPVLRRIPTRPAGRRAPGGVLPVERVPGLPTFQDWARREAAHARGAGDRAETAPSAVPAAATDEGREEDGPPSSHDPADPPVRRNPPRDWAAPPPWAAGAAGGAAAAGGAGTSGARWWGARRVPRTLRVRVLLSGRTVEGQGLAGSGADRLAEAPPPTAPYDPEGHVAAAGAVGGCGDGRRRAARGPGGSGPGSADHATDPGPDLGGRLPAIDDDRETPSVSSTRQSGDMIAGPAWRDGRSKAYPTIRSRANTPGLPRIASCRSAWIAALALFMLQRYWDRRRRRAGWVIERQPARCDAERRDQLSRRRPRRST